MTVEHLKTLIEAHNLHDALAETQILLTAATDDHNTIALYRVHDALSYNQPNLALTELATLRTDRDIAEHNAARNVVMTLIAHDRAVKRFAKLLENQA